MVDKINDIGIMLDCSRNAVMSVSGLKRFIKMISKMGFNSLQLYMEDTYEVDNNPYFGYMRGRYTKEELKEVDKFAKENGVELIPCIQTLAHLNQIFKWNVYDNMRDCADILLAEDEKTYELIENMFKTCSECFTTRRIHIGMDEAHGIGLGKYKELHGEQNRSEILVRHLAKVVEIATKYGFKPMMWSDMFFRLVNNGRYNAFTTALDEKIKNMVPENLDLVYWDYYSVNQERYDTMLESHAQFNNDTVFAGGAWSWVGFTPHNQYSIDSSAVAMKSCLEHDVKFVFATMWGDNGRECSPFSLAPALMCFAEFAHGNFDMASIKEKFEKLFGIPFDEFMAVDTPDQSDENKCDTTNPSKYLIYNDPFAGIFDYTVKDGTNDAFASKVADLRKYENDETFGYVFKSLADICDVLSIKAELGKNVRKAYKSGDKEKLSQMVNEFKDCTKKMEQFYSSFRTLWHNDNKSFGFEVQDIRLGGVISRLKSCTMLLEDYLSGKIDKIYELEEDTLCYFNNPQDIGKQICFNSWSGAVTTSVI